MSWTVAGSLQRSTRLPASHTCDCLVHAANGRLTFNSAKEVTKRVEWLIRNLGEHRDLLADLSTRGTVIVDDDCHFSNFDLTAAVVKNLCRNGSILATSRSAGWTRSEPRPRKTIPRPTQVPGSSPDISVLISPEALREFADTPAGRSLAGLRTNPFSLYRIPVTESSIGGELPTVLPAEPAPRIFLLLDFDALPNLRGNLIRLIDGIRAALCLVLVLVRAALARRLDAPSFLLVLVAISRRYGRRDESDDDALPARRRTPVIGGELALSC